MNRPVILVTGAAGEIGHGLLRRLAGEGGSTLLSLDLKPLDSALAPLVAHQYTGSVVDRGVLEAIAADVQVDVVLHLAALLSTRSEREPLLAHQVNVEGTLNLLELARRQADLGGRPVAFFYPSTIAVYGLPDLETKRKAGRVVEDSFCLPRTMYGCNKLYCEHLGRYYRQFYRQLDAAAAQTPIDFRSLRFPGLISAETLPTGGTSDYAPEMLHAAARGTRYACFVRADTRIPFMTMPDAIEAILRLLRAPAAALTRPVYNVAAFNPSAEEIRDIVLESFPQAEVAFRPDERRQAIVDSWPEDVEDAAARRDWGFSPDHGLRAAFAEYLVPAMRDRRG